MVFLFFNLKRTQLIRFWLSSVFLNLVGPCPDHINLTITYLTQPIVNLTQSNLLNQAMPRELELI